MTKAFILIVLVFLSGLGFTQKGISTFGIEYKPIIPNRIIGTFEQEFNEGILEASIRQKLGNAFGMVIRRGLTDNLSFETGLSFTQRNFNLNFAVPDSNLMAVEDVRTVAYEIPFKGLVFIRLGEQVFMNTSIGTSLNYFPSDVQVQIPVKVGELFLFEGARLNRIQGSVLADIGFEFRTRDQGYFYLGGSYNLPFTQIHTFALAYEFEGGDEVAIDNVRGSYITLDLRYYFNEKKEVKKKKK